jgi:putative flippase GtrA
MNGTGRLLRGQLWKVVKFQAVGMLNTGVDMVVFFVLHACGMPYALAQIAAYAAGMANSYALNKYWTFGQRRHAELREIALFAAVNLVSLGVSLLVLYVLHSLWALPLLFGKIAATALSLAVNFAGYRRLVFRQTD